MKNIKSDSSKMLLLHVAFQGNEQEIEKEEEGVDIEVKKSANGVGKYLIWCRYIDRNINLVYFKHLDTSE